MEEALSRHDAYRIIFLETGGWGDLKTKRAAYPLHFIIDLVKIRMNDMEPKPLLSELEIKAKELRTSLGQLYRRPQ